MLLPSFIVAALAVSSQWLSAAATQEITVPFSDLAYTTGNWSRYSDLSPINCTGGAAISFGVAGATASYSFRGIAVTLNVITATDGTNAQVTLDGETTNVGTLSSQITCSVPVFQRTGLDWNTPHTLTIRSTEAKSLGIRGVTYTTLTQSEQISLSAYSLTRTGSATQGSATGTGVPAPTKESSGSNTGAIVGGVVGGILGLLIIIGLIWFALRRDKKEKATQIQTGYNDPKYGQPQIEPQQPQQPPMVQPGYAQPQYGQPQYGGAAQPMSPVAEGANWSQQPLIAQPGYNQPQFPQQQYPQQQFAQQGFPQQGYPQNPGVAPVLYPQASGGSPPPQGYTPPIPGQDNRVSVAPAAAYPGMTVSPAPTGGPSTVSSPPPSTVVSSGDRDRKTPHGPQTVQEHFDPAPAYEQ